MNFKNKSGSGGPGDGGNAVVRHDEISFVIIDGNKGGVDGTLYDSAAKGVLNTEGSRIPSGRGRRSSSFHGIPDSAGIPLPNDLKTFHELLSLIV